MEKIKLDIAGLSYSQTQSGAYALVLSEVIGKRRLPIIIGGFEAQAIAIELEKMTPSRPLTHDLFKIYNLVEGIFFAKLICDQEGKEVEIDSRTSDAIALAVRFESPIYTYEFVLKSAGIILDDEELSNTDEISTEINLEEITKNPTERLTLAELKKQLKQSIENEDYEAASRFRDEINKRKEN